MQELNAVEVEEVSGGVLFVALLAFDVAIIAYDAYLISKL